MANRLDIGPENAAAGFGTITLTFGFGQIIGPAIAGAAADTTGSFSSGFAMAAGLAALAIVLTLFLRKPARARRAVPTPHSGSSDLPALIPCPYASSGVSGFCAHKIRQTDILPVSQRIHVRALG